MTSKKAHWDGVYDTNAPEAVSWYAPRLPTSLEVVKGLELGPASRIIDVGGGTSTFAQDLLAMGFQRPTVLDISQRAVDTNKRRMGDDADRVDWIVGDLTEVALPAGAFDLWHDRAVFHFLTRDEDRRRYVEAVLRAVVPGGHAVVATFGPEGPETCSGLDVVRYTADGLHAAFGAAFEKLSSTTETHRTPWGSEQAFLDCLCRRAGPPPA